MRHGVLARGRLVTSDDTKITDGATYVILDPKRALRWSCATGRVLFEWTGLEPILTDTLFGQTTDQFRSPQVFRRGTVAR